MTFSKKSLVGLMLSVAAVSALVFSLQAGASRGHHEKHGKLFSSGLVGNVLADAPIHGVSRAGAPWVLKRGTVETEPQRPLRAAREGARARRQRDDRHGHDDRGVVLLLAGFEHRAGVHSRAGSARL